VLAAASFQFFIIIHTFCNASEEGICAVVYIPVKSIA